MEKGNPNAKYRDIVLYKDVKIPMRDGTKILADIYFPSKDEIVDLNKKYYVILIRTPYNKIPSLGTFPFDIYSISTGMDYVFINNSVRGTNNSEGEFDPLKNEGWGEKKMALILLNGLLNSHEVVEK